MQAETYKQDLGLEIFGNVEIVSALETVAKGRRIADYIQASYSKEGVKMIEKILNIELDMDEMRQAFAREKSENPELFEIFEADNREFSALEIVDFFQSIEIIISIPSVAEKLAKANSTQEKVNILSDEAMYDELLKEIEQYEN